MSSATEALSARALLALGIQERHDIVCHDYSCKCHEREWHEDLQIHTSAVALAEADDRIATIEEDAVREYRFG